MKLWNYTFGNNIEISAYMILDGQCNWKHYGHIFSSIEEHSKYLENATQPGNGTKSTSVCPDDKVWYWCGHLIWAVCDVLERHSQGEKKKMRLMGSSTHCLSHNKLEIWTSL